MPLGPWAFKDRNWDGPVFDLFSGETAEDRNPLPPDRDEERL
jgi:hypothetical protein